MARNPESDCGLIAIDLKGNVFHCNSARVLGRPDVHVAIRREYRLRAAVIAMQNAIFPRAIVAEVAAAVAMDVMRGEPSRDGFVRLDAGTPLRLGEVAAISCDADFVATKVVTTDPTLVGGPTLGSAVYLNSVIYRDDKAVGRSLTDSLCVIEDGRIVSISGQASVLIPFTAEG